jgi:thiol-disulfide isomerase/thioredoxin
MSRPLAAVVAVWLATLAAAADPKPIRDDQKPAPSLVTGDPAPALKVSKWLQGDGVAKFEPGKVYVVEFWAAWCDARIRHLPRFADVQTRYKGKGATVIAFTSRDIRGVSDNTEDEVAAFVKKRGPTLDVRFAYAEDGATADAWLKGRDHFWTFIVDRTGRIAYAGSPLFVDLALSKVLAGGSAKEIGDAMGKVDAEYQAVAAAFDRDPEAGLRALEAFEDKYPPLADSLPAAGIKLHLLIKQGKGKEYADTLLAKAIKELNLLLLEMAYHPLRGQKENKELTALAVRAAEAIVRIDGGKDARSLLRAAEAHLANGDEAAAKEFARKALDAVKGEPTAVRESVEKEAQRLGAGK